MCNRKKLEPQNQEALVHRVIEGANERSIEHDEAETRSVMQMELPPWAENYDLSAIEAEEDRQLTEEVAEDKHRRVRHDLEPGDVIEAVNPVARISGVDSSRTLPLDMCGNHHSHQGICSWPFDLWEDSPLHVRRTDGERRRRSCRCSGCAKEVVLGAGKYHGTQRPSTSSALVCGIHQMTSQGYWLTEAQQVV